MLDYTRSMTQTFEFYEVDPLTHKDIKEIDTITQATITRDADKDTVYSASLSGMPLDRECYVRIYLIAEQDGERYKEPLATVLVQTPQTEFDGMVSITTMDAYSPLLELSENPCELGYYVPQGRDAIEVAYRIANDHMRFPVVQSSYEAQLQEAYVANTNDKWIVLVTDMLSAIGFHIECDEKGYTSFAPDQDVNSMHPRWTYSDDDISILYNQITTKRDLYGIPNVVEVVYSTRDQFMVSRVSNHDINSPISIEKRGREIIYRETEPKIAGVVTQEMLDDYAKRLLIEKSSIEYEITYSHGYCPVRLHDCVMINYTRAGIRNRKAKVISQTIECTTGCKVTETAKYTEVLWNPTVEEGE